MKKDIRMILIKNFVLSGLLLSTIAAASHHTKPSFQIYEVKSINGKELSLDFGLARTSNANVITVITDKESIEAKGGKITEDCQNFCGEKHCLKNGKYTSIEKIKGKMAIAFNKKEKIEKFKRIDTSVINNYENLIKGIKSQQPLLEETGISYELMSDSKTKSLNLNLIMDGKSIATEKACHASKGDEFTIVKCKDNMLLYESNKLLLVSSTDSYGEVDITLYSKFEIGKVKFYFINWKTKGRPYKALLKKSDDGWQLLKGIDDYPSMC